MKRTSQVVTLTVLAVALAGCTTSSDDQFVKPSRSAAASSAAGPIGVTLITKTDDNPFFASMRESAQSAARFNGIKLATAAGSDAADEQAQIDAINSAIEMGQKGILITPAGPGVNDAITKAREAGIYVIALDTPTDPPDIVDSTFATDNTKAGTLIGQWSAGRLGGKKATIAMLDLFATDAPAVTVDVHRANGFLTGMGITVPDPAVLGSEAPTGTYSGGEYEIACHRPTNGDEAGGRAAMRKCLKANPDINLVYTANEPSAVGAAKILRKVGQTKKSSLVSVDGGCEALYAIEDGSLDATAQQYPGKMAADAMDAIAAYVNTGQAPANSEGLAFRDTGVKLVTNTPVDGVESITTEESRPLCWG